MSIPRVLEHRETPEHVVSSGSGTPGNAQACRFVGFQNPPKPLGMPFRRVPEPDQATSHAVVSKSRTRPSHMASGCTRIQIATKPLCVPFRRDPDPGQATLGVVSYYASGGSFDYAVQMVSEPTTEHRKRLRMVISPFAVSCCDSSRLGELDDSPATDAP